MKKILVADDSVTIQKVIALTFADEPFEVQSVGTGAEALDMMNTWKPDILLADVIMPQMNGYELCRAVKEQLETSSVPVILLAGTFEAFDEEEARSVGADDYITKPFESGELIEKVNGLVGGKPAAEPSPEAEADLSQEEIPEEGPPPVEPPQVEPPRVERTGAPHEMAPEPDQAARAAAGPFQRTGDAESRDEPDIWDILSETEGETEVADSGIADAAVPGMGPIEDHGVVDVGSFDVGLDRPEQTAVPSEPQEQEEGEIPPVSAEPDEGLPVPGAPAETPASHELAAPASGEAGQTSPERSRVEDREKDFFGFETEGPEAAGKEDFLGDAVEEITFEVEEPAAESDGAKREESYIVPEPLEEDIPLTGETFSPEDLAPEPPVLEEQPRSTEESPPEEPSHLEFGVSDQEPVFKPEAEEITPAAEDMPDVFAPGGMPSVETPVPEEEPADLVPGKPAVETAPVVPMAEPGPPFDQEPSGEFIADQPSETAAFGSSGEPTETEIRKIVEERVEKVVWEVVPEMAEVLIREAIEKIKGKP